MDDDPKLEKELIIRIEEDIEEEIEDDILPMIDIDSISRKEDICNTELIEKSILNHLRSYLISVIKKSGS